ncbi:MAG TPA: tetratricopeptide repeat protein [Verrucomicrobiae bacterium]|nr:tetratricopeptide repeat protein [Verrucomicrobiae bacterium]
MRLSEVSTRFGHARLSWIFIPLFLASGTPLFAKLTTTTLPERRPDIETVEEVLRKQVLLPGQQKETLEQRARRFEANANDPSSQLGLSAFYEEGLGVPKSLDKAVFWLQKAAEGGLPYAQHRLASWYDAGYAVRTNHSEAVRWYRFAATNGIANSQVSLALSLTLGTGTETNYAEALYWLEKAAAQGNALALNQLGVAFMRGRGVQTNFTEALRFFTAAADKALPQAFGLAALVTQLGDKPDAEKSVEWAREGVKEGDIFSHALLGRALLFGLGTVKDVSEAVRLLHRAAENGNPLAQGYLAHCYDHGLGLSRDHVKARELLLECASKGEPFCMRTLANQHAWGWGGPTNHAHATYWYRKAAQGGDTFAKRYYGRRVIIGLGIPQDILEGRRWLEAAAADGDSEAMETLGQFYENARFGYVDPEKTKYWYQKAAEHGSAAGHGRLGATLLKLAATDADRKKALAALRRAAELGEHPALFALASIYLHGLYGVPTNHTEAIRLLKEGAHKESPEAEVALASCYMAGQGVPTNRTEAEKLCKHAAQQGHAPAQYMLGYIYASGQGTTSPDFFNAYIWFQIAHRSGHPLPPDFNKFLTNLSPAQIESADNLVHQFRPVKNVKPFDEYTSQEID